MISVKGLTKVFNQKGNEEKFAVNDLTFSAAKGEIVVLLGVNGAGKTTTMRMLSTVLKPTSGFAEIGGYNIAIDPKKVRERLGFLSGDTGLYGRLTARETITYFGRLYNVDEEIILERIEDLSQLLDMKSFLDKKIDKLSTGMKQKVSIARSIVHDPATMIFDEPTAGLDILTARNIVSFIKQCRDDSKCVLFSTHIMREAERIADKIVMIHEGKLLAEGTLEEFRNISGFHDLDDIFVHFVENTTNTVNSEVNA